MNIAGFDWDEGNRQKCLKHGVSIAEIEAAFVDGDMRVFPDAAHSNQEQRFLAIAKTRAGKSLFVAFTFREKYQQRLIRPISVRYMHQKEVEYYEKIVTHR